MNRLIQFMLQQLQVTALQPSRFSLFLLNIFERLKYLFSLLSYIILYNEQRLL